MTKNNLKKYLPLIFSLGMTILVLWQLLLPGYVITLDMVFGPYIDINTVRNPGDLQNMAPVWYLLLFITTILSGWIAQKLLLITIFFLLFYLPLHFFKKIFKLEETHGAEYVASLVFAINPFVYERFLAGQWNVLLGYSLLVPVIAYLIEFYRDWNYRNGLKLLATILILGAISTHILIMSLLVIGLVFVINSIRLKFNVGFIKRGLLFVLAVLAGSLYWLVPAILAPHTPISIFGPEHWEVFKTATGSHLGTLGNVLSLHGFWGEHEEWIKRFVLPKAMGWSFIVSFILFFSLIISGIYAGLRKKKLRGLVLGLSLVMFLALIFSCGLGEGIFRNFNLWLFEHISFWRGFRDSEKWSAFLALGYALFAGLGATMILSWFKKSKYQRPIFYILLAIPLIYTPMMLFGLSGQLQAIQYPASWAEVNNVLKQDKACRALFLPWHQYYSLKFNDDLLSGNPARNYFNCDIVHGKNMEFGSIRSQGGNGLEYAEIEKVVIDNYSNPDITVELLKKKGIKYIIYTNDVESEDEFLYPFLESPKAKQVMNRGNIYLYRLF